MVHFPRSDVYFIIIYRIHVSSYSPATTSSRWVMVLSPEESYGGLVSTSTELCQQAAQGRVAIDSIDSTFLNSRLEGKARTIYSVEVLHEDCHNRCCMVLDCKLHVHVM